MPETRNEATMWFRINMALWAASRRLPAPLVADGRGSEPFFLAAAGEVRKKINERSQEVIENKGDHFIANCKSQYVHENKWLILCKAKRLLINQVLYPDSRAKIGSYTNSHQSRCRGWLLD